jgi:hypothetical protein
VPLATPEQVAYAALLVQAYAQAQAQAQAQASAAAQAAWLSFTAWYTAGATAELGEEMAQLSEVAQDIVAGIAQQYVMTSVEIATGTQLAQPRTPIRAAVRNGAPLELVHTRPSRDYKMMVATGKEPGDAHRRAALRAVSVIQGDMRLAARAAAQATLKSLGITQYRRIIHPELSETGTCGLCIAAADRIYKTAELMPIHPPNENGNGGCKCTVFPIVGEWDPGMTLNDNDLQELYARAGGGVDTPSTKASDLSKVRYAVNEHGEFGPVLTKAGDSFRGPDSVALEDDPDRARRLLDKALPTLQLMESEGRPDEVLDYQRSLVDRLTAIAA